MIEQRNGEAGPGSGRGSGAGLVWLAFGLLILPPVALPVAVPSPGLWSAASVAACGALLGASSWSLRGPSALAIAACASLCGPAALALDPVLLSALHRPLGAFGALSGLGLIGAAAGSWAARSEVHPIVFACWLVLVALLGQGAATGWGVVGATPAFGPELTAALLDLSAQGFVLECGGVDWMRGSALYDAAGTDRIGPGLRSSWSGAVAAPLAIVVGCTGLLAARARR